MRAKAKIIFVILLLLFPIEVFVFEQHDYILTFERIEVPVFNKKHANLVKARNYKFNRTQAVMNCTFDFKTAFHNDLKINFQAYKFASNEYRLFPIIFTINLCDVLNKNDFGLQNLYNCGSFPRCPMQKGYFYTCNWTPDYTQFPPYAPTGRYKADMNFTYHSEQVFLMEIYYAIEKIMKF